MAQNDCQAKKGNRPAIFCHIREGGYPEFIDKPSLSVPSEQFYFVYRSNVILSGYCATRLFIVLHIVGCAQSL